MSVYDVPPVGPGSMLEQRPCSMSVYDVPPVGPGSMQAIVVVSGLSYAYTTVHL